MITESQIHQAANELASGLIDKSQKLPRDKRVKCIRENISKMYGIEVPVSSPTSKIRFEAALKLAQLTDQLDPHEPIHPHERTASLSRLLG